MTTVKLVRLPEKAKHLRHGIKKIPGVVRASRLRLFDETMDRLAFLAVVREFPLRLLLLKNVLDAVVQNGIRLKRLCRRRRRAF